MKVVVIGARSDGGAHMLVDLVADGAPFEIVAFLDDDPARWGTSVCGIPILGSSAEMTSRATDVDAEGAIVFLGSPRDRERVAAIALESGLALPVVVHPRAYVAPSATLGRGTFVGAMATVSTGAVVGEFVMVAPTALVSHHVHVGDLVQLSPGSRLGGRSRVGRGAFVGLGATILSERSVGPEAIVGAGAVVIADVPQGATVSRVRVRTLRTRERR